MINLSRDPARAIAELRRSAGISQAELARRMGTTQSAVARLESGRVSPSFGTVSKAYDALDHRLEVIARPIHYREAGERRQLRLAEPEPIPYGQAALDGVDVTQIQEARRRSPDERLRYFARSAENLKRFLDSAER